MSQELFVVAILLIFMCGVVVTYKATKSKQFKFSLDDMFLNSKGKTSLAQFSIFTALIVSTWGFVALVQEGKMTEWYMTAYLGAFVLHGLGTKYIAGQKDAAS